MRSRTLLAAFAFLWLCALPARAETPPPAASIFFDSRVAAMAEALARGDASAAARAVAEGADPNGRGFGGWTPAHYVCAYSHDLSLASLRALRSAGASLEARADDGQTPLGAALERSSPAAAKVLLSLGANPSAPARGGKPPLLLAIERSDAAGFDLLLRSGAAVSWPPSSSADPGRASLALARAGRWDWISRMRSFGKISPRGEPSELYALACASAAPSAKAFRDQARAARAPLPCER